MAHRRRWGGREVGGGVGGLINSLFLSYSPRYSDAVGLVVESGDLRGLSEDANTGGP